MQINSPKSHNEISLWGLFALAAVTVVVVAIIGFLLKHLGSFEMPLSVALNSLHHGVIGKLGDFVYKFMGPLFALIGTIVITLIVAISTKDLKKASTFAVMIAVTWVPVAILKSLIDRPRPDVALQPYPYHPVQIDGSYPSGHATFIAVLVIALVMLFAVGRARVIAGIIGAVLGLGAIFLLTVDGVHYVTDVSASIVWVLGVAPFVYAFWVRVCLPRLTFLDRWSSKEN